MKTFFFFFCSLIICGCGSILEESNIEDGYYDKVSYESDDKISVKLHPFKTQDAYKIKLYDINDKVIDEVSIDLFMQDKSDSINFWRNGYAYNETFSYSLNNKLASGIYYFENSSPFIVKRNTTTKKNKILIVYPSNTDNAYNENGGRSSYSTPKGDSLSFERPFTLQSYAKYFFKWIDTQDFEIDYICDIDMEDYSNIEGYEVIVLPGHSEYWSRKARRNFDHFIDKGGNSVILSGNTMWWQVRYSDDFSKMICFKNTLNDSLVSDSLKSVTWPDKILNYSAISSIGVDFTYGGYGNRKDKGWNGFKILQNSPLFKNINISLGDTLFVESAEYDGMPLLNIETSPIIDTSIINFYKMELLGYDRGVNGSAVDKNGVFIVFQKTETSGIIINAASTNWCAAEGLNGKDSERIKALTINFIDFLVNDKEVFQD